MRTLFSGKVDNAAFNRFIVQDDERFGSSVAGLFREHTQCKADQFPKISGKPIKTFYVLGSYESSNNALRKPVERLTIFMACHCLPCVPTSSMPRLIFGLNISRKAHLL